MNPNESQSTGQSSGACERRSGEEQRRGANERGAALATTLIILALMAAISMAVLAVATTEANVAGGDLDRTRTFYATAAGIEKMTDDFSNLFLRTQNPTPAQLNQIAADAPVDLINEGFQFTQTLQQDAPRLRAMRRSQGINENATTYPFTMINEGPYNGLTASIVPYLLTTTGRRTATGSQVTLRREMNNYLIPLFQFGIFGDDGLELHPGAPFFFNGRVHTNGNFYLRGNVTFLSKVTTAQELVYNVFRNGNTDGNENVTVRVGTTNVRLTQGSVFNGPNLPGKTAGQRGYHPNHPNGTDNANWLTTSEAAADGTANRFGKQVLTRTNNVTPLLLPLQLGNNPTRELIKRRLPNDTSVLSQSRYHTQAQIRILIDDEQTVDPAGNPAADAAAIPAGQGVRLSTFIPDKLGAADRNALMRLADDGTYVNEDVQRPMLQGDPANNRRADRVRRPNTGLVVDPNTSVGVVDPVTGAAIPPGAGLSGRILIQIIQPNGVPLDVTRQVLSMGMTVGEPNAILHLQRPGWAAFVQGSRDRAGNDINLVNLINNPDSRAIVDGEINNQNPNNFRDPVTFQNQVINANNFGHFSVPANNFDDELHALATPFLPTSGPVRDDDPNQATMNRIVPINVYNVREGWINTGLAADAVYERGITNVVEINMRNLARWVDGVYDTNLLAGTDAMSANINGSAGYIVYISDRRGDKVRDRNGITATDGMVENEDIYGPNDVLDSGEDVITGGALTGTLQKDANESELPDPAAIPVLLPGLNARFERAVAVALWPDAFPNPPPRRYFRRAVRLFNGEDLQVQAAGANIDANRLNASRGITVAAENMVYIWGNYNTTGITCQPTNNNNPIGSTVNNPAANCRYTGDQVPSSIVADAFFPLSKTWFDSSSAMYPHGNQGGTTRRPADALLAGALLDGQGTSVRAGIIAGNNLAALAGQPDAGNGIESRMTGGIHNYPRFLENWSGRRWNFVGSLVPLFRSTQALGPYNADSIIYGAPIRNWAFDETFLNPTMLPPGTPMFQFIQPTGFRQVIATE